MLWAKVVLPVVMVAGGTGAAAAAYMTDDGPPKVEQSRVWIDGPGPTSILAPGMIPVSAHATASADISALALYVDGKQVATDDDLVTNERLVFATFKWRASTKGEHELVVRQVGGTTARSDVRFVVIGSRGGAVAAADGTTTTSGPNANSTTTTSQTTSTSGPGDTTSTTGPGGVTNPPPVTALPTVPPNTLPPVTSPPTEPVVIDDAGLSSGFQNRIYVQNCGYSVQVSARIRNAEYADAIVRGAGVDVPMTQNGNTWTATLTSGGMFDNSDVGTRDVTVLAGRGDDVVDRVAGTITVIQICPKD